MSYKCEAELREKADQFIAALARAGFEGSIVPDSFRDYMMKVSICRGAHSYGAVNLHYSPQKGRFSLNTRELLDQTIVPGVEDCWHRCGQPDAPAGEEGSGPHGYEVYTDGSYRNKQLAYAVVVVKDDSVIAEMSGLVEVGTLQGMGQVGGELKAVRQAVEWSLEHGLDEISLFYDYEGVEKWATGEWRANNAATQAYAEFIRNCPVKIHWRKIRSHSGDRWNDRADRLAKAAAQDAPDVGEVHDDPVAVAQAKAVAFVEFLAAEGVAASFCGIINGQYARIEIPPRRGFLDIYNTKRRPLAQPYLHGFRDPVLESRVRDLWRRFFGMAGQQLQPPRGRLAIATHYYTILRRYRDCWFDFIDLARALQDLCQEAGIPFDAESARYDFAALEHCYQQLGGDNNDRHHDT